jgi:hypothetical protein
MNAVEGGTKREERETFDSPSDAELTAPRPPMMYSDAVVVIRDIIIPWSNDTYSTCFRCVCLMFVGT